MQFCILPFLLGFFKGIICTQVIPGPFKADPDSIFPASRTVNTWISAGIIPALLPFQELNTRSVDEMQMAGQFFPHLLHPAAAADLAAMHQCRFRHFGLVPTVTDTMPDHGAAAGPFLGRIQSRQTVEFLVCNIPELRRVPPSLFTAAMFGKSPYQIPSALVIKVSAVTPAFPYHISILPFLGWRKSDQFPEPLSGDIPELPPVRLFLTPAALCTAGSYIVPIYFRYIPAVTPAAALQRSLGIPEYRLDR